MLGAKSRLHVSRSVSQSVSLPASQFAGLHENQIGSTIIGSMIVRCSEVEAMMAFGGSSEEEQEGEEEVLSHTVPCCKSNTLTLTMTLNKQCNK